MSNPSLKTGIIIVLSGILAVSSSACSNNTLTMFSGKSANAAADSPPANPTTSSSPQPSAAPLPPLNSAAVNKSFSADPYAQAMDIADGTIKMNELANKRDDWALIAGRWEEAIQLLKTVPTASADYAKVQLKLNEYQRNLENVKEKITPPPQKPCAGDTNPNFFFVPILRKEVGIPVIEVILHDNNKFEMLFDTGATNTLITQQMANTLNLLPAGSTLIELANGTVKLFDTTLVKEIEIDSRVKRNLSVAIAPSQVKAGLLGQDFYQGYDITIKENVIEFHRQSSNKSTPKTETKNCPPSEDVKPEFFKMPIKSRKNNSILIQANFNDSNKFDMIFDTGASKTVITKSMFEQLKLPKLAKNKVELADGSFVTTTLTQIKSLEIDGRIKRNVLINVTPATIGLLGQDFFEGYDFTIKENVIEFTRRHFNE